jgi:hypothetical protein
MLSKLKALLLYISGKKLEQITINKFLSTDQKHLHIYPYDKKITTIKHIL